MAKFLVTPHVETAATAFSAPYAVEAKNSAEAKKMVTTHIAETVQGTVTHFERTVRIESLRLSRYRFWLWSFVNLTPEELAAAYNLIIPAY